jgi:hypothetical protein
VILPIHFLGFVLKLWGFSSSFSGHLRLVRVVSVLDERSQFVRLRVELIHVKLLTLVVIESVDLDVLVRCTFLHHDKVDAATEVLGCLRDEVVHGLGEDNRPFVNVT